MIIASCFSAVLVREDKKSGCGHIRAKFYYLDYFSSLMYQLVVLPLFRRFFVVKSFLVSLDMPDALSFPLEMK